jgi:flagellar biosynthesis protein FliQ
MNIEQAIEILRELITMSLLVMGPILVTTMVVGVVVSLFQSVTSIQESTLSFVPKLIAAGLAVLFCAPWILRNVMQFFITFISRLPDMTK